MDRRSRRLSRRRSLFSEPEKEVQNEEPITKDVDGFRFRKRARKGEEKKADPSTAAVIAPAAVEAEVPVAQNSPAKERLPCATKTAHQSSGVPDMSSSKLKPPTVGASKFKREIAKPRPTPKVTQLGRVLARFMSEAAEESLRGLSGESNHELSSKLRQISTEFQTEVRSFSDDKNLHEIVAEERTVTALQAELTRVDSIKTSHIKELEQWKQIEEEGPVELKAPTMDLRQLADFVGESDLDLPTKITHTYETLLLRATDLTMLVDILNYDHARHQMFWKSISESLAQTAFKDFGNLSDPRSIIRSLLVKT
uniref:Uncharacterized protein n=1 Tax=Rhodosorus marinus TaxID=101924 RepID=A0A7S3A3C9_9RHOD|mmetsp:Transcript_42505/g.165908  ORF Transcript_42505/g.165908 Transcript_42505/m.165908 type:complete len:311 (+) Transcript_42505:126-1058(+)